MNHGYNGMWGFPGWMTIVWVILLAATFIIVYKMVNNKTQRETPLDILKKRFARGEISKEEYEEKKKTLEE